MEITTTEYLRLLAEFNKNYVVAGITGKYFGRVEIHIVNGKVNYYKIDESIKQDGAEKIS